MKIAVIGSGISGLSSAYYLSKKHKVDLFEKQDRFGGHSYTLDIKLNEKEKKKGYQEGEKVTGEIKKWDKAKGSPEGRIVKSFGFGEDDLDAYSILYEYGLSTEFEKVVAKSFYYCLEVF